jgi:hypothetical protein
MYPKDTRSLEGAVSMAGEALLEEVKRAARYGQILTSRHARDRLEERSVSAAEVSGAIATATKAIEQPETETIRLEGGTDADGLELTVVVAMDRRGLRLVTVL